MPPIPIIPRKILFGNPSNVLPKISPDGKYLAYIAPKDDVLNIYLTDNPKDLSSAKAITNDKVRGIRNFWWSFDHQIVYPQDKEGDEVTLTPFDGTTSEPVKFSPNYPNEVIISINKPDPTVFSLYRCDLKTGEINLIEENTQSFDSYFLNDDLEVCFASKLTDEAGKNVYRKVNNEWELMISYGIDDVHSSEIFSIVKEDNEELIYLIDSRDREYSAIYKINLNDPEKKLHIVAEPDNQEADINNVLTDPNTHVPLAYSVNYLRTSWNPISSEISSDLEFLKSVDGGDFTILSQTLDNTIWIVCFENDTQTAKYYLFDRSNDKCINLLFNSNPNLENYCLAKLNPIVIKSRDGLDLVSYLTLPLNKYDPYSDYKPTHPLPMVLNVHGGPWARDSFVPLRTDHQFFANRGYAVLSVNFRSSTGLGKSLLRAGNGEWGAKAHDDLIDAVNWAIDEKIAEKDKIAIYGGSYGGYAVLAGLTFTPNVFAVGVDIVGPSNLVSLLNSVPSYWKSRISELIQRIGGNPETEEGVKFLTSRSPLTFADNINKPLLICQGQNDPRVKRAESYVLFNDEGHGFVRPQNRISFYAMTEKFLSKVLGGKYEEKYWNKDEHSNLLNVYHIDLASLIVTKALDIQPNDIVLDLCAAPGGKSLAILQHLLNNNEQINNKNEGRGMLIANEINNKRFHRLLQVIKSYIPFKYHQYQIKLVKNSPMENYCYDKILVDAPCSSERHLINDQKELLMWKKSRSNNFSKKQYKILLGAVKALKVNGILVYSTCSISNLENDRVIKKILENSWVRLEVIKRKSGWEIGEETEFGWIILPDKNDGWVL
ncbi:1605_t:CDS:10 [Rhizophagus irregularis]|nr:1605_t:CDS:10 [Rhizophagus irregularis]